MSEKEASWWDWVQSTKDMVVNQSSEVLEFVKKDIEEFSKVVTEEASSVVSTTATTIKEKLQLDEQGSSANQVKKSVSGFLNHVAEVFTPSPDDEDQEAILIWNQQPITLDRLQASKYALCSESSNFLKNVENEEQFEKWLQTFNIEAHATELPQILLDNPPLNKCYSSLVPVQISHTVFWHRYFYEMERLEEAEKKRQEMRKRAQALDEKSNIVWEEDGDLGEKVTISEQMQTQLLEDYEKEMNESETPKTEEDFELAGMPDSEESSSAAEVDRKDIRKSSSKDSKSSTPTSKDTDDGWEKVEPESQGSSPTINNESDSSKERGEDWETWE